MPASGTNGGQGKEKPFSGSNFAEVARVPQLRACRAPQRSLLTMPAACPSSSPGARRRQTRGAWTALRKGRSEGAGPSRE